MALADPQSVTIGGTTTSLPRTSSGVNSSMYTSSDSTIKADVSHAYNGRTRRTVRFTTNKITTDPLNTGQNMRVSASAYVVLNVPASGFTATEQKDLLVALATWLTASTAANTVKLVGGEN